MRRRATRSAVLVAVLAAVLLPLLLIGVGVGSAPANAAASVAAPARRPDPPTAKEKEAVSAPVLAAIEALRNHPPIYNSSHAPLELTDDQEKQLLGAIAAARTPIYVAILPRVGMTTGVAKQIAEGVGRPGTYVAVVGTAYDAYSKSMDVRSNLTRSFAEERINGTASVLIRFCELVADQSQGITHQGAAFPWPPVLAVLALAAVVFVIYLIFRSPSRTHDDELPPDAV